MLKIINGRRYDTGKARRVGGRSLRPGYPDWLRETLYRKRTGEYFVFSEGGPESRCARQNPDGTWAPGERVSPMRYPDVVAWARDHLEPGEFESEFGKGTGPAGKASFTVAVSHQAKTALERAASRTGKTQSAIVEELIIENCTGGAENE